MARSRRQKNKNVHSAHFDLSISVVQPAASFLHLSILSSRGRRPLIRKLHLSNLWGRMGAYSCAYARLYRSLSFFFLSTSPSRRHREPETHRGKITIITTACTQWYIYRAYIITMDTITQSRVILTIFITIVISFTISKMIHEQSSISRVHTQCTYIIHIQL